MRTTPIGHKYDPHHPDVEGHRVVLAADFDICKKQGYDILTDYEKEHALRLAAERQVGELREQLNKFECATDAEEATALAAFDASAEEGHQYDLESFTAGYDRAAFKAQIKLDEAMTLLRDIDKNSWSLAGREAVRLDAILNTTSIEGKDHE